MGWDNWPMDTSRRDAPESPFGPAPSLDLAGWRFGALLDAPRKQKLGFFIDPIYMSTRCQAYARIAPGSSLADAVLAVAFPAPIHALLENWRSDWRGGPQSPWFGGRDKNVASVHPEGRAPRLGSFLTEGARFACISARPLYRGMDDADNFSVLVQILSLWRQELESRGARCLDWSGDSLVGLSNGFTCEEVRLQAACSSDAAFATENDRESLQAGTPEGRPTPSTGPRPRL